MGAISRTLTLAACAVAGLAVSEPARAQLRPISFGSGSIISAEGHVLTNAHVIVDKEQNKLCDGVTVHRDGEMAVARILAKDLGADLAVLRMDEPEKLFTGAPSRAERNSGASVIGAGGSSGGLSAIGAGGSDSASARSGVAAGAFIAMFREELLETGEPVFAVGYPLGPKLSSQSKITQGIVSNVAGYGDNTAQFQLDAVVNGGNSGGPVVDASGSVVGVVVSKLVDTLSTDGRAIDSKEGSFAIKGETVKSFLNAHSIPYQTERTGRQMSSRDVYRRAQPFTVMITCYRG